MQTVVCQSESKPRGRALLVGTFLSSTLANHSVGEDLAERLASAGWDIITTSSKPSRIGRLHDMVRTTWRRRHDYTVAQVDIYSGLAFGWAESVCWTLRRAGKRYVLTLHGGGLPKFARRWPNRVRRLLRSAAVVTTPSRYLHEEMAAYRQDLRLLPNPLNLDNYEFRHGEAIRPRLVWLRSFHRIYDPTLAPQVVARLKPEFPNIRLVMVGPDKGDGSLQQTRALARQLGVESNLDFAGGVAHDEVPLWLAKGDVFLNTSTIDNTPVSVLEAMACGHCVVSTNVGGIPYLLEQDHDALLVPPQDPQAMAAAVRRILTEFELAKRLSLNARMKAEQMSWQKILPCWQSLLEEAAK